MGWLKDDFCQASGVISNKSSKYMPSSTFPTCPTDNFNLVKEEIRRAMDKITRPPDGAIRHPFLLVNYGGHYAGAIFCWDHFFMSLRFLLAGEPEWMRHLVDNLLAHQISSGFVPNVITREGVLNETVRFQAQPFLAQAAWLHTEHTQDNEWATSVWPKLIAYLDYYEEHLSCPGGYYWGLSYQSGFDNDIATTPFPPGSISPCDLISWLLLEYRAMEALAKHLDMPGDWANRVEALTASLQTNYWHEEEGTFCARNLITGQFQLHYSDKEFPLGGYAHHSCSNLLPLFCGAATLKQARTVIEKHLLAPEHFWSESGIRSLSRKSPYLNNALWGNPTRYQEPHRMTNSNWQGPIWFPICYLMAHALKHYGYLKEASQLATNTTRTLANSVSIIGSFTENFHSETGAPLYASHMASWNLLGDVLPLELSGMLSSGWEKLTLPAGHLAQG